MKLLNHTTTYFAGLLLVIISVWAVIFYYGMLEEIYDSIDDGLDNQKQLIIRKAELDSSALNKASFGAGNYVIHETSQPVAKHYKDVYSDTMMYMQNEEDFEPVRMLKSVFLLRGHYYELSVATSMVEEDDLVAEMLYMLMWLYAGLVITILLLNNFLLKKIWRPFYKLLGRLKNFSFEDPKQMPRIKTRIDEFKLMDETVQQMIAMNADLYNTQRQFIENASHELQTPLAISLNKLEALAENDSLSEEAFGLLSGAIDNLERLTRLNKSLLLLSTINKHQFDEIANVKMDKLIQKAAEDFSDQLDFNKLTIHITAEAGCTLQMNRGLASILVNNLVKNAIVHNIPGGSINVFLTKEFLRVENTGQNIPLDEVKIFTRFYKGTPSSHSTGLGLAIVVAITKLYHFRATYNYNEKHILTIFFSS